MCGAGQKIRAHKIILTRSPFFAAMFSTKQRGAGGAGAGFSESKQELVEIKDVDAQVCCVSARFWLPRCSFAVWCAQC